MDDEPELCAISKEILESFYDMNVMVASSVKEALKVLRSEKFDAIISDYQMPGTSGIEFVRELRSSGDRTPFILFTGRGREEVVISAVDNGADGYVQKGTDIKAAFTDLAQKIRNTVIKVRAEMALEESEARYRSMIDGSPTGMFLTDEKGYCIYSNPGWQEMTVLDKDGALGMEWMRGIHEDDRAALKTIWNEAVENSTSITYEFRYWRGRQVRWIWGHLAPIHDAEGHTSGFLSTNLDISDRRKAEKALIEKDRIMSKASSLVKIGYWIWSGEGELYHSEGLNNILGIPEGSQLQHDQLFAAIHPEDQPRFIQAMDTAMKNRGESELEHRMVRSDGSIITVHEMLDVTSSGTGRPLFVLGMVQDITEEKEQGQKVREKEDLYRIVFDTVAEGLIVRDSQGKLILCNAGAAKQFDVESGERLVQRGIDETHLIMADGSPLRHEDLPTAITFRTGSPISDEVLGIKKKDGGVLWVKINSAPFFKYGAVQAAIVCLTDITQIIEAEGRIRENEAKFQLIADNMTDYITVLDTNFRITYASPSVHQLLGYTSQEYTKRMLSDLFTPDALQQINDGVAHKLEREMRGEGRPDLPVYMELEMVHKNGSHRWVGNMVRFIRDDNGKWAGFIIASRDVTEQHMMDEDLRRSDKHFAIAQSLAKLGSWKYEIGSDAAIWTSETFRIFGRDPSLGAPNLTGLYDYIEKDDLPKFREVTRLALEEGLPYDIRVRIVLKNGVRKTIRLISDIKTKDGAPVEVWGALQDVTDQVAGEHVLEEANRKIGLMTGITRHDIKNQLQVLSGWLDLMKLDDQRNQALLEKAFKALTNMRALIEFTAEYESLGTKAPHFINVEKEVSKIAMDTPMDALTIINELHGDEILADPLLVKVLYNMVENAKRHGGKATFVRFRSELDGEMLRLICEDDGVGVKDSRKEAIFDHTSFKGHGYGLFFTRTMLAITGLSIWEEGRFGEGARFVISVPRDRWRRTNDQGNG